MSVSWKWAKQYIDDNESYFSYIETDSFYDITVFNGISPVIECRINKLLHLEDKAEFELSYKDMVRLKKPDPVYSSIAESKHVMKPFSIKFTAAGSQTTTHYYKFTEAKRLKGGVMLVNGANVGDTMEVYLTDKDNILGLGADYVLNDWIDSWLVFPGHVNEINMPEELSDEVAANLYLRFKYTNVGLLSVTVMLNVFAYERVE